MNFPIKFKKNGKGPMTGGEGEKVTCSQCVPEAFLEGK